MSPNAAARPAALTPRRITVGSSRHSLARTGNGSCHGSPVHLRYHQVPTEHDTVSGVHVNHGQQRLPGLPAARLPELNLEEVEEEASRRCGDRLRSLASSTALYRAKLRDQDPRTTRTVRSQPAEPSATEPPRTARHDDASFAKPCPKDHFNRYCMCNYVRRLRTEVRRGDRRRLSYPVHPRLKPGGTRGTLG
jgi:hypothetical protein